MLETLSFKPLTRADLALLTEWFTIAHIKAHYARNQHYSLEQITEKYGPRIDNPEHIWQWLVCISDTPVGYCQSYALPYHLPDGIQTSDPSLFSPFKPETLLGLDCFIAPTKYLRQGLGRKMVQNFMKHQVPDRIQALVVEPKIHNPIAISFFKSLGFNDVGSVRFNGTQIMMHSLPKNFLIRGFTSEVQFVT